MLKQSLTKWEPHWAFGRSFLLSETNLEWMNYICLFSLSSCPPKSFCLIISNTAVPRGFPERKICCHMAVGNNTCLSITDVVGLIFTKRITGPGLWCKCVWAYRWRMIYSVGFLTFPKSFADVERCTYVVHLFCVCGCMCVCECARFYHCVVVEKQLLLQSEMKSSSGASRYCYDFDIDDFILKP